MALKHAVLLSCCVILQSLRVNIGAVFMFDCGLVMNFFLSFGKSEFGKQLSNGLLFS